MENCDAWDIHIISYHDSNDDQTRCFDTSWVDTSLTVTLGRAKIVFLNKFVMNLLVSSLDIFYGILLYLHRNALHLPVGVEHLIVLLTPHCIQIPLMLRMFPVWDFVVGIFAQKALLNMGLVLPILSCQYLYK